MTSVSSQSSQNGWTHVQRRGTTNSAYNYKVPETHTSTEPVKKPIPSKTGETLTLAEKLRKRVEEEAVKGARVEKAAEKVAEDVARRRAAYERDRAVFASIGRYRVGMGDYVEADYDDVRALNEKDYTWDPAGGSSPYYEEDVPDYAEDLPEEDNEY